jgi:catechol 2,3-dioxygenase
VSFLDANPEPPFDISRASHVELTASDLAETKRFYTEILGLVVSDEDPDNLYLRGVEERCHHSFHFRRSDGEPVCERVGMRLRGAGALGRAERYFAEAGYDCRRVESAHQGGTLHVADPVGIRLELCESMEQQPRLNTRVELHRGAACLRLDHYQIHVPDPVAAADFYAQLGFRVSDYYAIPGQDHVVAIFMHRKGGPYDIVLFEREGPRLHHLGLIVTDVQSILKACDVAGNLGYGDAIEYGPGRHALGHGYYCYLRDPDGHRLELLLPPIELIDTEDTPVRWELEGRITESWGLPPQQSWFTEATPFRGVDVVPAPASEGALTLERYLGARGSGVEGAPRRAERGRRPSSKRSSVLRAGGQGSRRR